MNSAVPTQTTDAPSPIIPQPFSSGDEGSRFRIALSALWALYVLTLRQYSHGKRWMVVTGLFLLPSVLAIVLRTTATHVPPLRLEFLLIFLFIPQAILPLVALLYASSMIQDELEEQTITYLLIRPLPKFALYLVKLLATITATVALTVVFTLLAYGVIYIGADSNVPEIPLRAAKAAAIHSLAIIAYCGVFGLVSLLIKRSLTLGIVYIVIVEGFFANFPFGLRLLTVIYYTRLIAYRTLPFTVVSHGATENLSAEFWQFNVGQDPNLLEHPQLITSIGILLAASAVCTILAATLFTLREFHVKTPENS
jgi:ABC-2 type transport system permease protein